MRKRKDFAICKSDSGRDLREQVEELFDLVFELVGQPFVYRDEIYQAMIKIYD